MPYKATTNWKFLQPYLPAKWSTTFRTYLATPTRYLVEITGYDIRVKKFPTPIYPRCRKPQLKNWKIINCKFLQFSNLHLFSNFPIHCFFESRSIAYCLIDICNLMIWRTNVDNANCRIPKTRWKVVLIIRGHRAHGTTFVCSHQVHPTTPRAISRVDFNHDLYSARASWNFSIRESRICKKKM